MGCFAGAILNAVAVLLDADPRRVVSHNDVNPMTVLWDGARAWLVDWEVAGLGHAHYDLAVLALFLHLEDDVALELVARWRRASQAWTPRQSVRPSGDRIEPSTSGAT